MKKALSALLSILLLLGSMNCLFFGITVSAETTEVTRANYTFEDTNVSDIVTPSSNCTAVIDDTGKLKSGNSLKITLPAKQSEIGDIVFQNVLLKAGNTYKISLSVVNTGAFVWMGLYSSGTVKTTDAILSADFERWNTVGQKPESKGARLLTAANKSYTFSGSFTADETGYLHLSAWNNDTDAAVDLYIDNFTVSAEMTEVTRADYTFEDANLSDIVTPSSNCTAVIDDTGKLKSGNSLKITLPAKQSEIGDIVFQNVLLKAGNTYKVSLNAVHTASASDTYVWMGLYSSGTVKTTDAILSADFERWNTVGQKPESKGARLLTAANKSYTFSGSFTADETECFHLSAWNNNTDEAVDLYIDNLVIEKVRTDAEIDAAVAKEFEFKGTSIRISGTQALRFKTQVNKAALAADYNGYTIAEYGFLAFRRDYMEPGDELTVDTAKTQNGKIIKALQKPAYVKGSLDVVFDENDNSKLFTAALYNIKAENYNVDYAVRTYVVLQGADGSKRTVYVTDTQAYSVNEIARMAFEAVGTDYTDVNGNSWAESYETRAYLYENILSKLEGGNYTAPAQPAD